VSRVRPEISRPSASFTERHALGIAAFEYKLPIQDKLARVAQLGADCCELAVPGDVTLENAAVVADALAGSGVRVTALASLSKPNSPGQTESGIQLLDASIRCAEALGAPYAVAYFGGHPDRSAAEAIERYRELVRPSIQLAAELGVSILIENHFSHAPGDVTSSPRGCADLIAAIDAENFALNFDPCNFAIAGVDVVAAYAELKDVVRNVHVKDARPYDPVGDADYPGRVVEDLNHGKFLFVPAGEGIADNASVLQALFRAGNAVPVTVEAHTPVETLDEVFAQGLSYCRIQGL
jgi:sugar phosphate isomerase/epimerase